MTKNSKVQKTVHERHRAHKKDSAPPQPPKKNNHAARHEAKRWAFEAAHYDALVEDLARAEAA